MRILVYVRGVHVCVGVLGSVLSVHLYLFVCSVACYSILDPFGETQTRFRFVFVVDPIHRQFEDRSI